MSWPPPPASRGAETCRRARVDRCGLTRRWLYFSVLAFGVRSAAAAGGGPLWPAACLASSLAAPRPEVCEGCLRRPSPLDECLLRPPSSIGGWKQRKPQIHWTTYQRRTWLQGPCRFLLTSILKSSRRLNLLRYSCSLGSISKGLALEYLRKAQNFSSPYSWPVERSHKWK